MLLVIQRGEDAYEIIKDNMLPPDCDIEKLYYRACENLARDVEFVFAIPGTGDTPSWRTDTTRPAPCACGIYGMCACRSWTMTW